MVVLLLFGLLILSFPIYRSQLKIAALLDVVVVLSLFVFRVLAGTALPVDWIVAVFLLLDSASFFFSGKETLA